MQTSIPAEEIVQIVDRNNQPVNAVPRQVMRKEGLIHRASYILVFHPDDRLFVQKRTITKDVFPGYWDVAAGGVVLAGEEYMESAKRELAEELGLNGVALEFLFDHFHEDSKNRIWGHVFRCFHPGPFVLQEEEIESGEFMSIERIFKLSRQEPFTPDGLDILKKLDVFEKNRK
jgi:8-oxo-dGTP pyrophosphatase MutT (NUDIX family)